MKIVIATAVYYPQINGVAVFSHNLAVGLARRGNEVLVICPSQTGKNYTEIVDGVKVSYLKSVDVKIYPDQVHKISDRKIMGLHLPHLFYKHGFKVSIFPHKEIKQLLNEFEPDVVHIQVSDPIGLSVVSYARKNGIPVVTTEHNQPEVITDPLHIPKFAKRPANYLLSSYFRNRQSKSDFVTMPTEQAIKNLILDKKQEFPVPVAAVSNGVDLSNFKPIRPTKEIYKKYNLANCPTVLYVGRLDPEKNVGAIIDAFLLAERRVERAQLVIVGDGVDKSKLVKKAIGYPNIHFLGRILPPDLYELYRVGSVFATASPIETQGIVLIEAAASGLPLIAVNAGAVAEVCIDNKNGFLCEPGNVAEISGAMVKLLSNLDLQKKFSKESVKIASKHDFEKTLDRFINIYEYVIKNKTIRNR